MIEKLQEKQKAIGLRKRGLSYSEILRHITVSKSTLSLWLRSVGLSQRQKQRLTEKKLESMQRGWIACRNKRIKITEIIKNNAKKDLGKISKRDLWLIGIALYWAEGRKEKNRGVDVGLINSDEKLIKAYLKWLQEICNIKGNEIHFRIYLHETSRHRLQEVREFWASKTRFPINKFEKVSWKKHRIKTLRKNVGKNYFGLLSVRVEKSTNFNRKIQGWIEGILENL